MKEDSYFDEYSFWVNKAIKSPEWEHLEAIYEKHKAYCESQVKVALRKKAFDEAYAWQLRADDVNQIKSLIDKRIEEVKKERRNEDG